MTQIYGYSGETALRLDSLGAIPLIPNAQWHSLKGIRLDFPWEVESLSRLSLTDRHYGNCNADNISSPRRYGMLLLKPGEVEDL